MGFYLVYVKKHEFVAIQIKNKKKKQKRETDKYYNIVQKQN